MNRVISGIHHVTAIASDPQRNLDFYTQTLGLRLVKVTVNYDDPGSYHLYYGDSSGAPGSILTFFAWSGARRGRRGTDQATSAAFAVPPDSLDYWERRLADHAAPPPSITGPAIERSVTFEDPDGLLLRIVEAPGVANMPAWNSPVPAAAVIRGFHSVQLTVRSAGPTQTLLTESLGFGQVAGSAGAARYAAAGVNPARTVEIMESAEPRGSIAVGSIHHVAWRTPDDASQAEWLRSLKGQGYGVSPVMDRQYFHSIYFREPGGVLFEIATDPPGFTADEPLEDLGTRLCLPSWLEPHRDKITGALPPLNLRGPMPKAERKD